MNKPYKLQRFSIEGRLLMTTDEHKFMFDYCEAYAYLAYTPFAHEDKLIDNMLIALRNQHGRAMAVNLDGNHLLQGEDIPMYIREEMKTRVPILFTKIYLPLNVDLYRDINDTPVPMLEAMLFFPKNHEKYFSAHSVCWDYKEAPSLDAWNQIANEVAELQKQCIPANEWLPKND